MLGLANIVWLAKINAWWIAMVWQDLQELDTGAVDPAQAKC